MAKKLGRTMLIRIGDGAETEVFAVLCGLTAKTFSINNSEIDVTTADCTDPGDVLWTEVLAGVKRVNVSGNGLFKDEASEARINTVAMSADAKANFEIIIPDFGTFAGRFMVSQLDWAGDQDGGQTYALTLGSDGAVAFTAAA